MGLVIVHKAFYKKFYKFDSVQGRNIIDAVVKISNQGNNNGLNMEPIGNYYWSYRVNSDIRIIAVKSGDETTLVYVGHHEDAYRFCNSTKPSFANGKYVGAIEEEAVQPKNQNGAYNYLKQYGFDNETIGKLNACQSEQDIENTIKFFAPEYKELILNKGSQKTIIDGYSSDLLVINDDKELEKALTLNYPEWCVFLHPKQVIVRDYDIDKNLFVQGGPGTGKTVTMVWRYIKLYRQSKHKKPIFLCRSATTALIVKNMIKQIDPLIDPAIEPFPAMTSYQRWFSHFINYSHIVIDEAQDLSDFMLEFFLRKTTNGNEKFPKISMAFDFNQSILNIRSKKVLSKIQKTSDTLVLTYCYRCTEQIIDFAKRKLKGQELNTNADVDEQALQLECPLVGNDVIEKSVENQEDADNLIDKIVAEQQLESASYNWCIILSGFFDDKFFNHLCSKYPDHVFDVEQAKGNEFFVGIVLHYSLSSASPRTTFEYKKMSYEPYVALTRFRDLCFFVHINRAFRNERNVMKAQGFEAEDIKDQGFECSRCHRHFEGVPAGKAYKTKCKYCSDCWAHLQTRWTWGPKLAGRREKRKTKWKD